MYFKTALSKKISTVKDISIYGERYGGIANFQIDPALYAFTALESLYISQDFVGFDERLGQLQALRYLSVQSKLLKTLPEALCDLGALGSLTISSRALEALPQGLARLQALGSLTLRDVPGVTALPSGLGQLPRLRFLSVESSTMEDLTALEQGFEALETLYLVGLPVSDAILASIVALPNLKHLYLKRMDLQQLPASLVQLSQLESLSVSNNALTSIPELLLQLPQLQTLDISNNQLHAFPTFLEKHPQQPVLNWSNNPFGEYPKALAQLPKSMLLHHFKAAELKQYQQFIDRVQDLNLTPKALDLLFLIKNSHPLPVGKFERADFLAVWQYPDKSFQQLVLERLLESEKGYFEAKPLTPQDAVAVVGKSPLLSKTEIRTILKQKNIPYHTKPNATTTHLLVGTTGIKPIDLLANSEQVLISSQAFQDYANAVTQPYLLEEESADNLDHIATLLLSTATDNQQLGIELLKGGGVPKELATELFVVYKFSEDKKLASKARKLLQSIASTPLLEALKQRVNLRRIEGPSQARGKIEQLTKGTELEAWKIAQYAMQYHSYGWSDHLWLALEGAPKAAASAFLKQLKTEANSKHYTIPPSLQPHLSLIYEHYPELTSIQFDKTAEHLEGIHVLQQLLRIRFYFTKRLVLPQDLAQLPQLFNLEFLHVSDPTLDWEAVVQQLAALPHLRQLSLSTFPIGGLPNNLPLLSSLTKLTLRNIPLSEKDLELLAQLPKLASLDVFNTSAHLDERYLQLPHLHTLTFEQKASYTITPKLAELESLRQLNLSGSWLLTEPLCLPQLEVLRLRSRYLSAIDPTVLEPMQQLKSLILKSLCFKKEPHFLKQFQHLETLSFYRDKLSFEFLRELVAALPNLRHLSCRLEPQEQAALQTDFPELELY